VYPNADVDQSKIFLNPLLEKLLEEEIFLRSKKFRLPLEICSREKIFRGVIEDALSCSKRDFSGRTSH
jgi:hypothetical protein